MKLAMIVMLGALLAGLGACQTDMTGPRPEANSDSVLGTSPNQMHRNVEHGDVYLEEYIDRYDLGNR